MILTRPRASCLLALAGGLFAHAAADGLRAGPTPRVTAAPALAGVGPGMAETARATPSRGGLEGPLQAEILRTIDGDTFEARLRVWFGQEVRSAIRIRGFDAPERAARCPQEAALAEEATVMLRDVLASGPVSLSRLSADKYFGRIVSTVTVRLADGVETDVADLMMAAGMGRPYAGGRREGWCADAPQRTAMTGVPTRTRSNRSMTSSSYMRMQP